jgi:hypothetical protein
MSNLTFKDVFNANIQELLYKKYIGIVNTGAFLDSEYAVNAAPAVLSNKIYLDDIPLSAPVKLSQRNIPNGTAQDGSGYPYLVFYKVKLTSLTGSDKNFVYDIFNTTGTTGATQSSDNILTDAIASNYDPNGTYGIKVNYDKVSGSGLLDGEVFISNYTFDKDGGVLSIYGKPEVSAANPPTISFWRYEGRKGSAGFASDWYKYAAKQIVDMSGFAIKGLPDISSDATSINTLLKDVSDNFAVSVAFLKKYVELSGGSGGSGGSDNIDLTGNVMSLSGDAWDASGFRIDNIENISLSTFTDYSSSAINVNTLLSYLSKANNRGEYLMWNLSGDNKWSVQGTNNVVLGKNVGIDISSGAVVIGTEAGVAGVGNNSIVIGANADVNNGVIPKNTIVLNATGGKLEQTITERLDNKVVMYVKDLYSSTTLNGNAKALYYDPSTNSITAGDICGITMYREDAGDASGWYRYPAEQAINMQGTPAGTEKNYIFGLQDPSSAPFDYYDATKEGAKITLSGDVVYKTMATTVGWVQDYVSSQSGNFTSDVSDAQSATVAVNSWVQQFVIDAPPAPTLDSSGANSQTMTLSFNNPPQVYVGAFDMRLPALKRIWVTTDVASNINILSGNTTFVPDVSEIKQLVFGSSTSATVTGVYSAANKSYSYKFTSNPAGQVTVSVWYTNGNITHSNAKVNKLVALIGPFTSAGYPSSPILYDVGSDLTTINDTNVGSIKWKAPQYYDADSSIAQSTQTLYYRITLTPTATTRYNGLVGTNDIEPGLSIDNITDLSINITSTATYNTDVTYAGMSTNTIFPDTSYNYTIGVSNVSTSGPFTTTSTQAFRTSKPILIPVTTYILTIPSAATTTQYYSRNQATTLITNVPLVNRTNGATLTDLSGLAIHTMNDIGKSSAELTRTLIANIKNGSTSIDNQKSYDVKGFGDATVSNISVLASSAQLTIRDIRDQYISGLTKRKGYYKIMRVQPSIISNGISNVYTLTTSSHSDVILTYYLNIYGIDVSANFRVDDLSSTVQPSFINSDCTTGTSSFTRISGLPYLNNNATLTIASTINNLANRYYRQNGVTIKLQDSSNVDISSITFTTASEITFIDDTNNASINKGMMFSYTSNLYSMQLKARIDAQTVYNSSSSNTIITKNYLLDQLNFYRLSQLASEQTIIATNTYYLGYPRNITNNEDATIGSGIFDYTSGAPTDSQYDHSIDLTTNKALQLVKGRFTTKTNNNNAYLNYTANNGASDTNYNYTIISGMRYIAFSCAVNTTIITTQNALRIRLNNVSASTITATDAALTIDNQRAYIYYRYSGGNVDGNSIWIEATKKNGAGGTVSSSSLNNVKNADNNVTSAGASSSLGGTSSAANAETANVFNNNNILYENLIIADSSVPSKITVLIAVPNSVKFSFESASIQLGAA